MRVRDKLPKRRTNPSKSPAGNNWSEHKPDLREDFNSHCGYCGCYDGFSHTYFEVDHFVPKSIFTKTGRINTCQYDNLVYSCKFCNNKKLNKWPSNDEVIPNINNKGFVDPTLEEYDIHIYRTDKGSIRWYTELGRWMVETGFKFDERDYCIRLLWELDKLKNAFEFLISESKKYDDSSLKKTEIIAKAKDYSFEYMLLHSELMEYYKTI